MFSFFSCGYHFFLYFVRWIKVKDNKDLFKSCLLLIYLKRYWSLWGQVIWLACDIHWRWMAEWFTIRNWIRLDVIFVGMLYTNQFVGIIVGYKELYGIVWNWWNRILKLSVLYELNLKWDRNFNITTLLSRACF